MEKEKLRMPKNIVIINDSPRKDGNTEILVEARNLGKSIQ